MRKVDEEVCPFARLDRRCMRNKSVECQTAKVGTGVCSGSQGEGKCTTWH